jgi:hypothetical protein
VHTSDFSHEKEKNTRTNHFIEETSWRFRMNNISLARDQYEEAFYT